jgi:predicted nuclease of predicted toxin-antitoxin system
MRFLADEGCDFAVVRALRDAGHDIAAIAEGHAGVTDLEVMAVAAREGRIVISEDKDFGQLSFAGGPGGRMCAPAIPCCGSLLDGRRCR